MASQGTWGIGGYNLPDFGLTEKVAQPGNTTFYNPQVNFDQGLSSAGMTSGFTSGSAGGASAGSGGGGSFVQYGPPNILDPNYQAPAPTQQAPQQSVPSDFGGGGAGTDVTVGNHTYSSMEDYYKDLAKAQNAGFASIQDYENNQKSLINSQFGEYFSNLDRQLGALPGEEALQAGKVGNMATSSESDINLGKSQTEATINQGVTNAQENKNTSIRGLEQDMRSALFAGNQYLGARGAGDSSATDMYKFALSKQANKGKSDILKTFNTALAGLDQKKVELQNITNNEMTKLKTWKDNALLDVTNYINQKKDNLLNMVSQGKIDQATALRELNTNIYNQAQARLAAIDQQATAFAQGMQSWATQRAAQLNDYKLQLTKSANFSIPDIIQSEMMAYAPQGGAQASSGFQGTGAIGGKRYDPATGKYY